MGRVKSKFPTGNIVIKNRKPNKEGKVALYLCLCEVTKRV